MASHFLAESCLAEAELGLPRILERPTLKAVFLRHRGHGQPFLLARVNSALVGTSQTEVPTMEYVSSIK